MTPGLALASAAFRLYVLVSLSALGGAGAIIAAVERVLGVQLASIRATWRSWLWMTPLVLAVVLLGRQATIAGVTVLSLLGFLEFARATRLSRNRPVAWTTAACIAAVGPVTLLSGKAGSPAGLFMALPVLATLGIVAVPAILDRTRGQLRHVALGALAFTWLGWSLGHVGLMTNAGQPYGPLLFLVLSVEICDVAAFTAGRLFGRHRLRPRVSPGKTWAGLAGATALGLSLPWLLGSTLPGFSDGQRVLAGLIVGLGGQIGDLAMSAAKRDLGVKDLGTAIPGHGGVLDRIDSLLFAAPLFFWLTQA